MYGDDILLIAPSVKALQRLINVCATELAWLDMSINCIKSVCMLVGPRYKYNLLKFRCLMEKPYNGCHVVDI